MTGNAAEVTYARSKFRCKEIRETKDITHRQDKNVQDANDSCELEVNSSE